MAFAIAASAAFLMYNKPHDNMWKMPAAYTLSASDLFQDYETDELKSNEKYLGQVLEVTGTISHINMEDETLTILLETANDMFAINCQLNGSEARAALNKMAGDRITIKGKCNGMLMDVVMNECIITS